MGQIEESKKEQELNGCLGGELQYDPFYTSNIKFYVVVNGVLHHLNLEKAYRLGRKSLQLSRNRSGSMLKRLFDVTFSFSGLVVLFPLFILIGLLIKMDSKGPIFYKGIRVGRFGKPFRIFKFRTMVVDAESIGGTSTPDGDPRITQIGRFLRKYKLDEFPQLINVLSGEMSFVGPRPQVPWAVRLYNDEEKILLSVRPGITDYASIKFSNEGEILHGTKHPDEEYLEKIAPEKLELGLQYVRNCSFWVDLKILVKTIKLLLWH